MKIIIFIGLFLGSQSAFSFDFESLFLPGDVIKGHVKIESDCKQCHVRSRDLTQKTLCLTCHKKIRDEQKIKQGFHSKHKQAFSSDCQSCHTEHKGRDKDIINLDRDQFNHNETDFKLTGKHQQTACNDCHKSDKKYREAPKLCISCHEKQDVHKKKLGRKCQQCHTTKSWRSDSFDHDKTKFKLRHAHKKVKCSLCHLNQTFKNTPKTCISCHVIKDVHNKKFGTKCSACHNQKKWSELKFKHNRDTLYKLKGAHANTQCVACHQKITVKRSYKKQPRKCFSCHKSNDVHKGRNGKKCQSCHKESSWLKTSFDHDKTDFKLKGLHKKASCQSCHQNDVKGEKTKTSCISCHQQDDVHKTQLGKDCSNCHNEQSWLSDDVRYDHDLSDFPLIGQHSVVSCESCHFDALFKDTKKTCVACHALDDVHKKHWVSNAKAVITLMIGLFGRLNIIQTIMI